MSDTNKYKILAGVAGGLLVLIFLGLFCILSNKKKKVKYEKLSKPEVKVHYKKRPRRRKTDIDLEKQEMKDNLEPVPVNNPPPELPPLDF